MATHGIDHVLSHLHPTVTWANPVLTIHLVRSGPELRLNGQGLILIPGAGRDWTIMTAVNDHEPASLVYPAYPAHDADRPALRSQPEPGIPPKQLIALFGQTRARVLVTVGNTASLSTTQIADHCAISLSSASEHATVLRQAGLLASNRRGETMRHSITSLGMRMLSQHR
jgi:DNA-binding transcriptional ArsR family regulator